MCALVTKRDAPVILQNLRETLETAELGFRDLIGPDPQRRVPGLRNFVVFGRAVTNVVQTFRSIDPLFDEWYGTIRERLAANPDAAYFYRLRSQILKEGALNVAASIHIRQLTSNDLGRLQRNAPPGAQAFFFGDHLGGTGWEVHTLDGSIEKFYVELPPDIARNIEYDFVSAHLPGASVKEAAARYLAALSTIVEETEHRYRD